MQIEALPPDGGVARAFINSIEHIRLRDLAEAVPGLQADPRWPSISFHDTAARMFVEHSGIEGVMLHSLPKRGRYVPRDQLQPAIDYLTSSATITEAQNRTWASINANRKRRKQAMTPLEIEVTAQYSGRPTVYRMTAPTFKEPIQFALSPAGIFFSVADLICELTEHSRQNGVSGAISRHIRRLPEGDHLDLVARARAARTGGRPKKFMHERHRQGLYEILARRPDYDKARATHLERRIAELEEKVASIVVNLSLDGLGQPDPVKIVGQTMGAGAETLPRIDLPSPTPEIERLRREHGHRWVEDSSEARAEKLEELKKVQPDPDPNERKVNAVELVRRMGLVETSQEALIERIDAVLAQKDVTIAARDRQIAALQELVIDLGHRCVSLLGGITELKAIASR